MQTKTADMKSV